VPTPSDSFPAPSTPRWTIEPVRLGHWRLAARVPIAAAEVLAPLRISQRFGAPGRHTLQISEHDHATLDPPELALIDHSCAPSVQFDLDRGVLVALRAHAVGDPLTAFYPATEWRMAEPFACSCGTAACLATISGARDLPAAVLGRYGLSRHVQRLLLGRRPAIAGD
jgi:hypothetical protein